MRQLIIIALICFGIKTYSQTDSIDLKKVASYVTYLEKQNSLQKKVIGEYKISLDYHKEQIARYQRIDANNIEQQKLYKSITNDLKDIQGSQSIPFYKDPFFISTVLLTLVLIAR